MIAVSFALARLQRSIAALTEMPRIEAVSS
jgi:hypothetical protein